MGPKKVDPDTKQKEFEIYCESEEFQKVKEIHELVENTLVNLHGDKDPFLSETSKEENTSGKHQVLWDKIYELSVLMKIKPPFKKIEHEWVRSTYFGEKIKVNKDEEVYEIDGIVCEFDNEQSNEQNTIKQALHKGITNKIRDMEDTFTIDNYTKTRAEIKKGLSEFYSGLKVYIKKSFKIVYEEKFMTVLRPFSDLLEVNMKLVLYELKYGTEDEKFVNDFKRRAIVDRYCECLEIVLNILMTYHSKPIRQKIRPSNIFKKLDYSNHSKIESFYLKPFTEAFDTMKEGLCALFTTGINFWKLPIEKNVKFVEHLAALVNWELVTERHFGSQLLRDQINFVADTLDCVARANSISKDYMISRDPNSMEIALPRLLAFKTIQRMRNYKDKEEEIRLKQEDRRRILGATAKSASSEADQDKEKSLSGSPSGVKNSFGVENTKTKSKVVLLRKDSLEEQRENLGRYWIWENYCDEGFRDKVIEEAVEKLKHINPAVQQDIEDSIIREGMLPRKDRHNKERIEAAEILKDMKTLHNTDKSENMRRPPELWNFPKVIEQQHHFRSIAEPKKCYIDGRVEELDSLLTKIADYLRSYNKQNWNEILRRVIDFFQDTPNPDPAFE